MAKMLPDHVSVQLEGLQTGPLVFYTIDSVGWYQIEKHHCRNAREEGSYPSMGSRNERLRAAPRILYAGGRKKRCSVGV